MDTIGHIWTNGWKDGVIKYIHPVFMGGGGVITTKLLRLTSNIQPSAPAERITPYHTGNLQRPTVNIQPSVAVGKITPHQLPSYLGQLLTFSHLSQWEVMTHHTTKPIGLTPNNHLFQWEESHNTVKLLGPTSDIQPSHRQVNG